MEYSNIKVATENSVATIRLNRPDAMNALSSELLQEFSNAVAEVGRDQGVKALVIRGEGRSFCAGADLKAMGGGEKDEEFQAALAQAQDRAVAEIQTMLGLHTYQPEEWRPPVLQTRATDGTGVPEVLRLIDAYCVRGDTEVGRRRRARFEARVRHLVSARLLRHVEQQALEAGVFARILDQVVATEVDPYTAAEEIVRQAVNTTSAS